MNFRNMQLGQMFEYLPKSKIQASQGLENGKYKFFTSSNVQKKWINEYIYFGEALVFGTGGTASLHYVNEQFSTTTDCFVVKLIDGKNVFLKYVYHYLISNFYLLENGFKGAGLKHISKSYVESITIPLPTFEEQKRIAEILDKANEIKDKRELALAKLDELAQITFIEMFGDISSNPMKWDVVPLNAISVKITDGEHLTPQRTTEGIKLLSARNIQDGYLSFDDVDYVGEDEYQRISKRCNPQINDILISCSGSIGRVSMVRTNERLALVRSAALVKPNASYVNSIYLEYFLRSKHMKAVMISKSKSSSQANLFQAPIKSLLINLPPLAQQEKFESFVTSYQKLKERFDVKKYIDLSNSLQNQAFTTGFNA